MGESRIRYAKTVDGLDIAYQTAGEGPFDLVYAPGWVSNLECVWEMPDLGDFLRRLAGFSRLILFDRRGSGLSDRPFTTESPSLEAGMDDIRAVMDAAGSERAVLFGVEDGGSLCCLFAASYPDRVSALVLFSIFAKYRRAEDFPWWWTDEAGARLAATHRAEMGNRGVLVGRPLPVSEPRAGSGAPARLGPVHTSVCEPGNGPSDRADRARGRSSGRAPDDAGADPRD